MGNFISNLIARHTTAASYVMPRHRGRFEPQPAAPAEAAPASFRADMPPSAEQIPAAANTLPAQPESMLPPVAQQQEMEEHPAVSPAKRTVAPPETLLPLFTPPAAAAPEIYSSSNSAQEHTTGDHYPDPVPIPGTVNNLFTSQPPQYHEAGIPLLSPGQEQQAAERPLYFTINQSAQQDITFTMNALNNANGHTAFPHLENHFSPGRSIQRSGQRPATASAAQPVIKVSIGRIDVRAVTQPAAAKQGAAAKPAMSLDDFLKKRSGGTS